MEDKVVNMKLIFRGSRFSGKCNINKYIDNKSQVSIPTRRVTAVR